MFKRAVLKAKIEYFNAPINTFIPTTSFNLIGATVLGAGSMPGVIIKRSYEKFLPSYTPAKYLSLSSNLRGNIYEKIGKPMLKKAQKLLKKYEKHRPLVDFLEKK